MPTKRLKGFTASEVAKKYGFRSGLEEKVASSLKSRGIDFQYESEKIHYLIPESEHTYTPDFRVITKSGKTILIETKGRFLLEDRQKHLHIKRQYPELDIRFVFQSPGTRITKGSNTTYAMWCARYGFKWAGRTVPDAWLEE